MSTQQDGENNSHSLLSSSSSQSVEEIRQKDFPQLHNQVYLDWTASAIPSKPQMDSFQLELFSSSSLFSNPHSLRGSPSARKTNARIRDVRARILRLFDASPAEWDVVFTANATAALKMVGELFPFSEKSSFYYHWNSHTSVVGIRQYAVQRGAKFKVFKEFDELESLSNCDLIAFPLQCNFSGSRYIIPTGFEKGNALILGDAASFVSSSPLSLANSSLDFMVCSFYKMFGFPSNLGALLVRKTASNKFVKPFFGGGTVNFQNPMADFVDFKKSVSERLEDGTLPFLEIIALDHAMDYWMNTFGYPLRTCTYLDELTKFAFNRISSLTHYNGLPLCYFYSDTKDYGNPNVQGPIINFNLLDSHGAFIGYSHVAYLASQTRRIHFRTGAFCNIGASMKYLNLTEDDLMANFKAGHVCGDDKDVVKGKATGSIRISLGPISTEGDIEEFVSFLRDNFIEYVAPVKFDEWMGDNVLLSIFEYPLKSCKGQLINCGEIVETGLKNDRKYLLLDEDGNVMNGKRYLKMALLASSCKNTTLTLDYPSKDPFKLDITSCNNILQGVRMCGEDLTVNKIVNEKLSLWLKDIFEIECSVAVSLESRPSPVDASCPLTLSSESPFLLVSEADLINLKQRDPSNAELQSVDIRAFRPNFVISGPLPKEPFVSDYKVMIGEQIFTMISHCERCHMICVDPSTATTKKEPLAALIRYGKIDGRIVFGVHLKHEPGLSSEPFVVNVNDPVMIFK